MLVWAHRRLWLTAAGGAVVVLLLGVVAVARGSLFASPPGEIGPKLSMTSDGRLLQPAGRMTTVGDFPTGGARRRAVRGPG